MNELNIKIAGIGGSGANIINHLIKEEVRASEFMVIDTDKNLLSKLPDFIKSLQIGEEITQGNGTNGNYDKGLLSAYSNTKEITSFLKGSQIIVLTAGLGGGTASGSLQIISSVLRGLNIFTIGVLTKPFLWEGQKRLDIANRSIEESAELFNILYIIRNEEVIKFLPANIEFSEIFIHINDYLMVRNIKSLKWNQVLFPIVLLRLWNYGINNDEFMLLLKSKNVTGAYIVSLIKQLKSAKKLKSNLDKNR